MKDEVERETVAADGGQLDFVSEGSSFLFSLLLFFWGKAAFVSQTHADNVLPRQHPFQP